jgi:hypothetical protein
LAHLVDVHRRVRGLPSSVRGRAVRPRIIGHGMGVEENGSANEGSPAADVRWVAYGAPAYDELRRVVAAAKADDALAPVTLVVPSNLAGTIARRTLARMRRPGGGTGVAALTVLTVDRLAELVASPALVARGRRPATAPVLAAAWRQELADDARSFGPVAEHPATVRALVDAYRALRDVSPEARGAVAATGQLPRDVVTLFEGAATRLDARWYDVPRPVRDGRRRAGGRRDARRAAARDGGLLPAPGPRP